MSLQFVAGRSGSGKSSYIIDRIIKESVEHKDINYLYIVPEQFTMQTQKELVNAHPDKGLLNIDVLSFNRLAYRVFDELGKKIGMILADTGKNMVLRRVIEAYKEELGVYARNYNKQGFISEIKSFISEMYQYSISPVDIKNVLEDGINDRLLSEKLREIYIIYNGFTEYLSERYITSEELSDMLAEVIDKSSLVRNSVIVLDGFTGFTPSQTGLLKKIIGLADKVYVTLTIIPNVELRETSLFYLSYKTKQKLVNMAYDIGVEVEDDIDVAGILNCKKGHMLRFAHSEELAFLEDNIFKIGVEGYKKECNDIKIYALAGKRDEIKAVADEIVNLVSHGFRYSDIAVVCADVMSYGKLAYSEFSKRNIPVFIDQKRKLMSNPFIEMIESVYDIAKSNYSCESIVRYLRCGMSDIDKSDVDYMENYLIATGIKGESAWNKEFTKTVKGRYYKNMERVEAIRCEIIKEVSDIGIFFRNSETIGDYIKATISVIDNMDCENKLAAMADEFAANKDYIHEKEYANVYDMVMELFEQMETLLSDQKVDFDEYIRIFKAGIAELKVGVIPMTTDQVVLGDIERTRVDGIKALFMIGANDGVIPKPASSGCVISDFEREKLCDMGFELAPTLRQAAFIGQFYLYLNLTKPSHKLYLSYSTMSDDAKPLAQSYVIGRIMELFPHIRIISSRNMLLDDGMEYLYKGLSDREYESVGSEWNEILRWNLKKDSNKDKISKMVDAAFVNGADDRLKKEIVSRIYDKTTYSVSRLERFSSCAYSHFLKYGLGISRRQEYEISDPDIGMIFHSVFENYANEIDKRGLRWSDITKEISDKIMDDSLELTIEGINREILYSSKRNEYKLKQIGRIARKTGWVLRNHLSKGEFIPAGFEVKFLENVCKEGTSRKLEGVIDRIDVCDTDNGRLVKIIDYKSYDTAFDTALFENGISMQLIIYMDAAINLGGRDRMIPAGAFYYRYKDPIIDMKDKYISGEGPYVHYNDDIIEEDINKEFKMTGIINQDGNIINLINDGTVIDDKGNLKSDVINVKTDKSGGKSVSDTGCVTTDEFNRLLDYSRKKLMEIDRDMNDGKVCANPYKYKDRTSCDNCEYVSICRFDIDSKGSEYRVIESRKFGTFIKELGKEKKEKDELDQ